MHCVSNSSREPRSTRARRVYGLSLMCLLLLPAARLNAQCVGDCSGDNRVSMAELVTATRLALGESASCAAADRDGNGVTVDEVVASVNSASGGCAQLATPTPSSTPTPTMPQATATPTTTVDGCGDGMVDLAIGETCDDGNTVDGDSCPANCRIATCALDLTSSVQVDVRVEVPAGKEIVGVQTFLRYPDGVVAVRGAGGDNNVFDQISEQPDNVVLQPNDIEYGLIVVAYSFDGSAIAPGQLLSVRFNPCREARAPQASDFACSVNGAGDVNGVEVAGVTCSATLR